jgi:hypothetical protein
MIFQEEVKTLSNISMGLLQKLEPEPVYVRGYIEKECEKIQKEGWLEQERDRPWVRTFVQQKYTLKIAFIHARKGEHITGADLAFELKDKKVIFVQSKRVSSDGKIHFNRFQLQKLIELEEQICGLFPLFSPVLVLPFLPPYYLPFRATFYHLIMTNQSEIEERFFHTSEVSFTLAGNKSVYQKGLLNHGLKPSEFQKMFWECKIGGPDIGEDIKKDVLYLYSLLTNRFIIWLDIEER